VMNDAEPAGVAEMKLRTGLVGDALAAPPA
jgi:hypothetical protein